MQASLPSFSVISFINSNFNSPVRIILLFVFIYMSLYFFYIICVQISWEEAKPSWLSW